MEQDLTTGSVFKRIVYFSLPYLLSYFLQTLYGMADLFITGQFYGVDTITAVSNGSQIMHMMTVIIVGLAMGTTVTIGHSVGAKCMEQAKKSSAIPLRFYGNCRCIYRHTGCTGKADSGSDSNTAGSSGGNKHISFNLFYRDSVYYRL